MRNKKGSLDLLCFVVPACSPVLEICVVTAETAHFMMMGRIVSILEVHVESSTDGDASADHRKCAVSSMLHRNLVVARSVWLVVARSSQGTMSFAAVVVLKSCTWCGTSQSIST